MSKHENDRLGEIIFKAGGANARDEILDFLGSPRAVQRSLFSRVTGAWVSL